MIYEINHTSPVDDKRSNSFTGTKNLLKFASFPTCDFVLSSIGIEALLGVIGIRDIY